MRTGPDDEILSGGVNQVLRRGATVIRPAGAHTPAVHRLLKYIRASGFTSAPEVLDLDASVETLTYLAGEAGIFPVAEDFRTDRALITAAELLRSFHDATEGFESSAADRWDLPRREPAEVICHGDFAPYNCVIDNGDVVGMFDFDTAHPAPRLWDVGYATYRWAPLTDPIDGHGFGDTAEQGRRLRLFCASYGTDDLAAVIESAADRLHALIDLMRSRAASGNDAFAGHIAEGHDLLYLRDIESFTSRASDLIGS